MIHAGIPDTGRVILWLENDVFIRRPAAASTVPEDKIEEAVSFSRRTT